jgi:hypothetical protein
MQLSGRLRILKTMQPARKTGFVTYFRKLYWFGDHFIDRVGIAVTRVSYSEAHVWNRAWETGWPEFAVLLSAS